MKADRNVEFIMAGNRADDYSFCSTSLNRLSTNILSLADTILHNQPDVVWNWAVQHGTAQGSMTCRQAIAAADRLDDLDYVIWYDGDSDVPWQILDCSVSPYRQKFIPLCVFSSGTKGLDLHVYEKNEVRA